jgi:Caspase domain
MRYADMFVSHREIVLSHIRSRCTIFGVLFFFCVITQQILPASAQSRDKHDPTPLTDRVVQGEEDVRGQSYFYSFEAGPGDITVNFDGSTDYYSTNMHVVLSDNSQSELADIGANATSTGASKIGKIHLLKKQRILMRLTFGGDVGIRVKYKIRLDGPISFSDDSQLANNDSTVQRDGSAESVSIAQTKTASMPQARSASQAQTTTTSSPQTAAASIPSTESVPIPRTQVSNAQAPIETPPDDLGDPAIINTPIEDKWAFLVGISEFQKPEINLRYSAKDAKDLYSYLVNEAHFAPDHVKLLVNKEATKERVMAELGDKWLPRLARPNDLVLIFISTHGSPSQVDLEGLNYLVMYNTDPESLYATGLPLQDLAEAIKHRVHSNRVIVVVDACHSGAANTAKDIKRVANVDSKALLLGTGQLVICSSQPDQVSWESQRYQNGVFTHQLIEALRSHFGKATLSEAFEQLKESVQSEVLQDRRELQTAVLKSKWRGNEIILSTPATKPHSVPAELKIGAP